MSVYISRKIKKIYKKEHNIPEVKTRMYLSDGMNKSRMRMTVWEFQEWIWIWSVN